MRRTNTCNIQKDKILAEEVRKYLCLYDKSDKDMQKKTET